MKLVDLAEQDDEFAQPELSDPAEQECWAEKKMAGLSNELRVMAPRIRELTDLAGKVGFTNAQALKLAHLQAKMKVVLNAFEPYKSVLLSDLKKGAPITIRVPTKKGSRAANIATPITTCAIDHYIGPPSEYPDLTPTQANLLEELQGILIAHGVPPLSILVGGRKSEKYRGINFVATNVNASVVWRKYDPSPGAGQNWVYTRKWGQVQTSGFVRNPSRFL